jgi:hypothetical protein
VKFGCSIETRYGPDGPGIESLFRARFTKLEQTSFGANPTFCMVGVGSVSSRVIAAVACESKKIIELYVYSTPGT